MKWVVLIAIAAGAAYWLKFTNSGVAFWARITKNDVPAPTPAVTAPDTKLSIVAPDQQDKNGLFY